MQIKANDSQIKQVMINAIKASTPMGLGFLHYNTNEEIKEEDILIVPGKCFTTGKPSRAIHIDYYKGRMVKLCMHSNVENIWLVHGQPNLEYQSWGTTYKTYADLALSVEGVTII